MEEKQEACVKIRHTMPKKQTLSQKEGEKNYSKSSRR